MNLNSSHTSAILVFALSSKEESRRKNIVKGEQLFDTLTKSTLQTAVKTGLPIFHITENQQFGESFGERISNAVQYVFNKGFENVIMLGNDSPHLKTSHIELALSNLNNKRAVIGPSIDGGFYLLGLQRSNFKHADFKALSWQTSELKDEIVNLFSYLKTEVFLLTTLFDIDSFSDIKMVSNLSSGLSQKILKTIRSLISSFEKIEITLLFFTDNLHFRIHFNKGSPFIFSS